MLVISQQEAGLNRRKNGREGNVKPSNFDASSDDANLYQEEQSKKKLKSTKSSSTTEVRGRKYHHVSLVPPPAFDLYIFTSRYPPASLGIS
ncbi:hypothetical protein TNCV_1895381 [Trichonephila clavipes]|nr:hypothetical protein TNCV_1895381 [Trichonephila clavipes]